MPATGEFSNAIPGPEPLKKRSPLTVRSFVVTVDLNRLRIEPGHKILDIGCGSGRHLAAAYGYPQVTVVGGDRSFKDLNAASDRLNMHDRLGEHGSGTWYLAGLDATALPFKDNWFELVICSEVLEHVANHLAAVHEIARVLKPGCNLVVSVPRYWPEHICWALSKAYCTAEGGHLRIFRIRQLIADLQSAGFDLWKRHYAHSLHAPFWWLKCLVGLNRTDSGPVNLYHRFLTWDIMQRPHLIRFLDQLLNPVLGKSTVLYLRKKKNDRKP
jgi:SAM-dependent methyltransferase